jgi:phosphoglycerol transferase MdoB-like AlkP superfamily enzyme
MNRKEYNRFLEKKEFFRKTLEGLRSVLGSSCGIFGVIFGILGVIAILVLNLALSFGFIYFCIWATIWVINLFTPLVVTSKVLLISTSIIFVAHLVIGRNDRK